MAAERGIRVLLDIVPNHTSIEHPWFADARSSRDAPHRDWYVWADPTPDGSPPNNWLSSFGGPAWTLDDDTGQYYLHNFTSGQPDLNWWNEEVRDEFDRILRFWFDRGVAGFRIDVAHMIVKDRELRDNPPATDADPGLERLRGQRQVYNANRPEVHDVHPSLARAWPTSTTRRGCSSARRSCTTWRRSRATTAPATSSSSRSTSRCVHAPFELDASSARWSRRPRRRFPTGCWPVWTGGNHDVSRFPTRWAGGDPEQTRARAADGARPARHRVPLLRRRARAHRHRRPATTASSTPSASHFPGFGRDPERTPMPWSAAPGAGFTDAGVEPWLPFGDLAACNVHDQRRDPGSIAVASPAT